MYLAVRSKGTTQGTSNSDAYRGQVGNNTWRSPWADVKAKKGGLSHLSEGGSSYSIIANYCQWEFWPRAARVSEFSREARNLDF